MKLNNKTVERLVAVFKEKKYVLTMSNKKIAGRNKATLEEVLEAKRLYRLEKHKALVEHCEDFDLDASQVTSYWHKGKNFSINFKVKDTSVQDMQEAFLEKMKEYSPKYPVIKREKCKDPHLLVVDPADIHMGKLCKSFETGNEYDTEIAFSRVMDGVKGLINKSTAYNVNKILLIVGNDILHIDNPRRTTTAGTPQDTDGMWYDNYQKALQLYVQIIENLLPIADVHVQYDPSNHDYTHGFFLIQSLQIWFKDNKNVTFNANLNHRKYFLYGKNLIGTTHGDGAKEHDLPLLMAQDAPKEWAESKYRYFYTHHIHHKKSKDYGSVTIESLRSPSGTDGWHAKNGYAHAPKAVEAFIHHPEHGQVARFTHYY